jgi:hypothetical protein
MAEVAEAMRAEMTRAAEEQRPFALLDPRLQLVGLGLRDPAGFEVGVDLVDRRRLRGVLELLRRDPEMAGDPGQKTVAACRRALGGGDRPSAPTTARGLTRRRVLVWR